MSVNRLRLGRFAQRSAVITAHLVARQPATGRGSNPESGDLCNFNFGAFSSLPKAGNGAHYDVNISGVNYLIQQMFQVSAPLNPSGGTSYSGSCALSLVPGTAHMAPWRVAVDYLLQ